MLSKKELKDIMFLQQRELTDHYLYLKLAKRQKDSHNKEVLTNISKEELGHYNFWKNITGVDVKPAKFHLWFYYFVSVILGMTFGVRLMELGEAKTQTIYESLIGKIHGIEKLLK